MATTSINPSLNYAAGLRRSSGSSTSARRRSSGNSSGRSSGSSSSSGGSLSSSPALQKWADQHPGQTPMLKAWVRDHPGQGISKFLAAKAAGFPVWKARGQWVGGGAGAGGGSAGGGDGGGGGGTSGAHGYGGGGSFLAPFTTANERAGLGATIEGLNEGTSAAISRLGTGQRGLKRDYARGLRAIDTGEATARGDVTGGTTAAVDAFNRAAATGRTDLGTALGRQTGAINTGYGTARGDINTGYGTAVGNIGTGYDQAREDLYRALGNSLRPIQAYEEAARPAAAMYANAAGLNGPAGHDAAIAAFRTSPGYDWTLNQGLTALDRRAASRGELGGGGNEIDTLTYAQGLNDQEWTDYLDRLAAEQAFGAGEAQQLAGLRMGAADVATGLDTGRGTALANLATGRGAALSGLDTGQAGALSDVYGAYGGALSNLGTWAGAGIAGAEQAGAGRLSDIASNAAGSRLNTYGTLGNQDYSYAQDLARLKYAQKTGQGAARAAYQNSKNTAGGNIWGTITGAGQLGASLVPYKQPQFQSTAQAA